MSDFKLLQLAIKNKMKELGSSKLFRTNVDKTILWDTYLNSYPKGTNNLYKTNNEYDCACCKQFIRSVGNVVAIVDDKLISIWDIEVPSPFLEVAEKMNELVISKPIIKPFLIDTPTIGAETTQKILEDGNVITYNHFFVNVPSSCQNSNYVAEVGKLSTLAKTCERALTELTLSGVESILDLINSGNLYRGDEYKEILTKFKKQKIIFDTLSKKQQELYCWLNNNSSAAFIRNSAIGTLLIDMSAGENVEIAVSKFEKIMAPQNYKRPKAIFTKKMIEEAQTKLENLGLVDSLTRKFATLDDININDVLFIDRQKKKLSVFDELKTEVAINSKKFEHLKPINISELKDIKSFEILMENKFNTNLMSLIGPENKTAPSILKWKNNFSWSYKGDVTDSLKQNVKNQGGNVDGVLRFSIQWNDGDNNQNDFDAHCLEPKGNLISYNRKQNASTTGELDIDIINPGSKIACENITWTDINKMQEGIYIFKVHNYSHNGGTTGFKAEIEYEGEIYSYDYNKELSNGEKVTVAKINFSKENGIEFIESLDSDKSVKEIWGIKTNTFVKVSSLMLSPNYWDGSSKQGNKHYFFMLENCLNPTEPRGFYNEYLDDDLITHKRVFEALGSKMRVETSDKQLSGIGFSTTNKSNIIAKINGEIIKINIGG